MKIDSAFICDDVRQENNSKLMFIGAYSQDILLPAFPTSLSLYIVLCARFPSPGPQAIEIEATLNKFPLLRGGLNINVELPGFSLVPIPLPLAQILETGDLKVRVKAKNIRWQEVATLAIKQRSLPPRAGS